MDMNLSKLREVEKDREGRCTAVRGVAKRHNLATEEQQTISDILCLPQASHACFFNHDLAKDSSRISMRQQKLLDTHLDLPPTCFLLSKVLSPKNHVLKNTFLTTPCNSPNCVLLTHNNLPL